MLRVNSCTEKKDQGQPKMKFIGVLLLTCSAVFAQQGQVSIDKSADMAAGALPIYQVSVTTRTVKAVNYRHRGGSTKIDFQGTDLLPDSYGEAKVESKQGYIEIEVEFRGLKPATAYGAEYLTYVMWAITPEGRTSNLGEVLPERDQKQIECHHRIPDVRFGRDGRTLFRGH